MDRLEARKLMNLSTTTNTADTVVEVLAKIVEFTSRRHAILTDNILNVNTAGFQPMDIDVDGFAGVIAQGLTEYIHNDRLVLSDIKNVAFGENGTFKTPSYVDDQANNLFKTDLKAYLKFEIRKYSENLLNKKVGVELLRQRQEQAQN
jgi:hypothetical protein